jgi:hypothetical protein
MLKINASYGLKEGRPNYGSESALCSVEMELSDSVSAEELKLKIHDAFCIVREQVGAELTANGSGSSAADDRARESSRGDRRPMQGRATHKQISFLCDVARDRGVEISELNARARELYGVDGLYSLTKADASKLIDSLKGERRRAA